MFNCPTDKRYVVEAVYFAGRKNGYTAIWVDGVLAAVDPRDFVFEPGPVAHRTASSI